MAKMDQRRIQKRMLHEGAKLATKQDRKALILGVVFSTGQKLLTSLLEPNRLQLINFLLANNY